VLGDRRVDRRLGCGARLEGLMEVRVGLKGGMDSFGTYRSRRHRMEWLLWLGLEGLLAGLEPLCMISGVAWFDNRSVEM
jgi:hypothetical protein